MANKERFLIEFPCPLGSREVFKIRFSTDCLRFMKAAATTNLEQSHLEEGIRYTDKYKPKEDS